MTFNDFLKTHKVNGHALCDVNGPHYLSDEEIKLLADVWNAAIEAALAAWNEVDADDIACLKSS